MGRSISTRDSGSRYSALRMVGTIYGILGWITIGAGVLVGIFLAAEDSSFVMFIGPLLLGAIVALPMLAAQDIVTWAIDLVSTARTTNALLTELVSSQESKSRAGDVTRDLPTGTGVTSPGKTSAASSSELTPIVDAPPPPPPTLSEEEKKDLEPKILELLSQGVLILDIAKALDISSTNAVEIRNGLREKFGVYTDDRLIAVAREKGYLSTGEHK